MNCQNTPPSQRGFTALELIIVLIIGFSIIGLSAAKMADMMDSSKATRALDSIVNLSTAIKSLANPQGYGATGDPLVADLINADVVPKSLRQQAVGGATALMNQWNQPVSVNVHPNDVQKFVITYPGIPKSACNTLVKDLLNNFSVVSIADSTNVITAVPRNATLAAIVNACNVAPPIGLVLSD
ncbi:type 4 pilus major pilin [unidentified bacterial endosymbiont]|uniref:type 4 pilus major pilin n=1 Tax=unidentified bacterial endosymbiont TaxID=2355 RepID=UPI0020A04E49|nr:type 4 pilus major pilin [unidentified bacterial endosymbiont]